MSRAGACLIGSRWLCIFFFNDTATTEIYTRSLHDALPIWIVTQGRAYALEVDGTVDAVEFARLARDAMNGTRSEEHTSELQSRQYLVCRLLLEKKKPTT